jgi:NADH:ubiquinone oxidoreductase subunit D/NADH:ubiquinone oxidoreductase subunit C
MKDLQALISQFDVLSVEPYKSVWLKVSLKTASDLLPLAAVLKAAGLTSLVTVSPTDFPDDNRIELNYFFEDLLTRRNVWLKVDVLRDLDACQIDSLTPLFPSVNWHEREAFSTFGVRFIGHPNLDYLFVSEDFYGQFPFRKGFDWQAHEANLIDNMNCIVEGFEREQAENDQRMGTAGSHTMLNWGPTHPASGPLRLRVEVDGEQIVSVKPDVGYVWRGLEHLVEGKDFIGALVAIERICFMDNTNAMLCYAQAVEEIAGKPITPFAGMMRVMLGEIGRVVSHLMGVGGFFNSMGLVTLQMWALDVREYFLDVLEDYSGARIATASIEPGGVRYPLNPELLITLEAAIAKYAATRDEFYTIFINNPTMQTRATQVGIVSPDTVCTMALTGVVARAAGVKTDIRLDEPYAAYDKIDMTYMLADNGSARNRFEVLFKEIDQSMSILTQAISDLRRGIEAGEYRPDKDHLVRMPKKLPDGEAISRVEWSRGEMLMHLVTKKTSETPYRLKIKAPSVNHTLMLESLLIGHTLSDIPLVFGSLYICQGDLDR